tara:strand:+ start:476 stop:676 length:201 start_codon:yes stop_codon:yes gene_type:complete
MSNNTILVEKAGQSLKAEYFATDEDAGIRCFINGEFIKEEIYQDRSIQWAQSAAESWIAGITPLNG